MKIFYITRVRHFAFSSSLLLEYGHEIGYMLAKLCLATFYVYLFN